MSQIPYEATAIRAFALFLAIVALDVVARAATPTILVTNAWSRPAHGTAVIYAVLRNRTTTSDRLVGAVSPVASRITLHQTSGAKLPPMSTSMDDMPMTDSMTSMKSLSSIPIPPGGTTILKPGGYHLMLALRRDIAAGQVVRLRLHFARAGWIATSAIVRAVP